MDKSKYYTEYCSGCGLCAGAVSVQYSNSKGFQYPEQLNEEQVKFCEKICPVNGINYNERQDTNLWGPCRGNYVGWATDREMRFRAATGGIITALACFLVETGECDAIIQIGSAKNAPFNLELFANSERSQIVSCAASRYITGTTFADLFKLIDYRKKYAVIGKPCDIEALTNYMGLDSKMSACIKFRMTFFCAGAPSVNASMRLAEKMDVSVDEVRNIRYRGMGWPGKATITLKDGSKRYMDYIDAWSSILGRDIRKMCKFCVNGIGMFADISCGDLWNLDKERKPSFVEEEGRNIVFARSDLGKEVLFRAEKMGYIHLEEYKKLEELKYIQPNHYNMQTTMCGKIIGLKLSRDSSLVPKYDFRRLLKASRGVSKIKIIRTALGTIKRQRKGSL